MEALIALVIAVLASCGIYLMLRSRTFPVILGLTLLSYAANLFIFVMGRLHSDAPPVIGQSESYTDPLPQALVLTAIVIGFAMTAFLLVLALRARAELGNDHVDGATPSRTLSPSRTVSLNKIVSPDKTAPHQQNTSGESAL